MNRPAVQLTLLLARRWTASGSTRRAAVLASVASALLMALYLGVTAFTPTARQAADRDFGTYTQHSYVSIADGQLRRGDVERARRAVSLVAPRSHLWVQTDGLRPDQLPARIYNAPVTNLRFVEDPGMQGAFPGRYRLTAGRWPTRADEVAVTPHLLASLHGAHRFTVLSGRSEMRIVGTVLDRNARLDDEIIAGHGTWTSFRNRPEQRRVRLLAPQVEVLWDGPVSPGRIAGALRPALAGPMGDASSFRQAVEGNASSRSGTLAEPVPVFGTDQVVVSFAPFLLLVMLLALMVLAVVHRQQSARIEGLVRLGLPRRRLVLVGATLLAVVTGVSGAAGAALGVGLVLLARPLLLQPVADETLAPPQPFTTGPLLLLLAAVLTVGVGSGLSTAAATRDSLPRCSPWVGDLPFAILRRVAVASLAVLALVATTRPTGPTGAYVVVLPVLLVAPDLLRLVLLAFSRTSSRLFVTRRLIATMIAAQSVAVVAIAACVAGPIVVGIQLASTARDDGAFRYSTIPPHQIWVQRDGDVGDVGGVAAALADVPGLGDPIPVRTLDGPARPDGAAGPTARLDKEVSGGTAVMVVPGADDLARLLGPVVGASERRTLDSGGVVNFNRPRGDLRLVVFANGGEVQRRTGPLPTADVHVIKAISPPFGGAILLDTARRLRLPISAPSKYLYPDVADSTVPAAVQAAVDAGYDGAFVQHHVPAPPPDLPAVAYVFFAGLALAAFSVLLLVVSQQVLRLRPYASRLLAIGLGTGWIRSVIALQVAALVAVGVVTGLVAGLLAILATSAQFPVLVIPALPIWLACASVVASAAIVTVVGARALTARDDLATL